MFVLVAQLHHSKEYPGSNLGMKLYCSKAFMVSLSPLNILQRNISDWTTTGLIFHKWFSLLLLPQLYNSLWVLVCSIIPLHGFLSCAFCFQLFTPIFLKSSLMSSSHLNLGLPFGLVACGFHLKILLTTLSSGILSTFPTQLSLLLLMCLTIFSWLIRFSNSSFVFCLHSPFVFCVGPKFFSITSFRIPIISA